MSSTNSDDIKENLEEAITAIRKHMTALIEKGGNFPHVVVAVTLDPKTRSPRVVGTQNIQVDSDVKLKDMSKSFGVCIAVMNSFAYMIANAVQPAVNAILGDNPANELETKDIMLAVYDSCIKALELGKQ